MAVHIQPSYHGVGQKFERLSFQYDSQLSVDSTMSSASSTPSTPTSPIDFEVRIATLEDKEKILEFLRTFFFRDEPLNAFLGIAQEDGKACDDLEAYATKNIDQGVSLLAIYDNKLIGVCLNGIMERKDLDKPSSSKVTDPKFLKIYKLLGTVFKESDPFGKFPESDKMISVEILSVDGTYRGKGIAKELCARTRELGKERGCGFMCVDCTSHFSARAMKRLGFELIYSKDYADYKVNDQVVFNPAPPHKAVTTYIQKIS